jgi:hypothetical protein
MARKTKSDVQESQHEHEERTDSEEKVSEEIKDDAEAARDDWADQQEPSLTDTADTLNDIAGCLKSDIIEQHDGQAEKVDDSIDTQHKEVSEPAREGEAIEREAADGLDVASGRNKRYGKNLVDAAEARRDAEKFLREVAETDEQHQERGKDTLEEHRRAVAEAVQDIREF